MALPLSYSWRSLLARGSRTAFIVSSSILVQAIFIAFFIGILAGWVPALGASRRSVAATLREVF